MVTNHCYFFRYLVIAILKFAHRANRLSIAVVRIGGTVVAVGVSAGAAGAAHPVKSINPMSKRNNPFFIFPPDYVNYILRKILDAMEF